MCTLRGHLLHPRQPNHVDAKNVHAKRRVVVVGAQLKVLKKSGALPRQVLTRKVRPRQVLPRKVRPRQGLLRAVARQKLLVRVLLNVKKAAAKEAVKAAVVVQKAVASVQKAVASVLKEVAAAIKANRAGEFVKLARQ